MTIGFPSVRVDDANPLHHLWCNNGTWWVHYTLHFGCRSRPAARIAFSSTGDEKETTMSEARELILLPYLLHGSCWVFDDERTGLKEEAFVCGMTEMITRVVEAKGIPDATRGFAMTFSDRPFPGHDVELRFVRPDPGGGNWYAGDVVGERMEGWLCPALLLYFREPPPRIFVRCDPLPAGVDPIWTPPPGAVARRFVEAPRPGA